MQCVDKEQNVCRHCVSSVIVVGQVQQLKRKTCRCGWRSDQRGGGVTLLPTHPSKSNRSHSVWRLRQRGTFVVSVKTTEKCGANLHGPPHALNWNVFVFFYYFLSAMEIQDV